MAFSLLLFGCKEASEQAQFLHSTTSRANESRYLSKGLVRLTTAYTIDNNQFNSTCSAALIHTPEASLNYCVAVSAAHCFQNIPKSAQHSIEVLDRTGIVIKSYRAAEIYTHPEFVASDGPQTAEQAANDVALIEFKCSLPNGIQPSKILDISQLPANASVTVASHERLPEQKQERENFVSRFLFPDSAKTPAPAARLQLRSLQVLSTDFPMTDKKYPAQQLAGFLSLEQNSELTACSGHSGAPAFFEHGNEIFLVATASSGQGFCDGNNLRFTLMSPHADWINKTMEHKFVVPALLRPKKAEPQKTEISAVPNEDLEVISPIAVATAASTFATPSAVVVDTAPAAAKPTPASLKPSAARTTPPADAKPAAALVRLNAAAAIIPQKLPTANPAIRKRVEKVKPAEADVKIESVAETPAVRPVVRPTVPPIPPPPPESSNSECLAVRLSAESKSRVWGTVLKLVDKESSLIVDDSLKCDFPNDGEICVVANPVATGTGFARAVLSQGINFAGCEKFYSGRTIYLDAADFKILP
jgi:hypothetical protein